MDSFDMRPGETCQVSDRRGDGQRVEEGGGAAPSDLRSSPPFTNTVNGGVTAAINGIVKNNFHRADDRERPTFRALPDRLVLPADRRGNGQGVEEGGNGGSLMSRSQGLAYDASIWCSLLFRKRPGVVFNDLVNFASYSEWSGNCLKTFFCATCASDYHRTIA